MTATLTFEPLQPTPPYELEVVDITTYKEVIGQLRVRAWRDEQGVDHEFFKRYKWVEDIDDYATHRIITDAGLPVAAARLSVHRGLGGVPYAQLLPPQVHSQFDDNTIASFSRLVVAPTHRGHSFSTMLDHARFAQALALGVDKIVGGAYLPYRQRALTHLGFDTLYISPSGPEMPTTPVHFMMYHADRR